MRERTWIAVLSLLAASRVFFACAALPFFNNVDEQAHFDLVWKYSRGRVPRHIEPIDPRAAQAIALAGSPEFFNAPEAFGGGAVPPPIWDLPPQERAQAFLERWSVWKSRSNHDSNLPPVYYAAAGAWLRGLQAVGLNDLQALYGIRFLNVVIAAALVWLAWYFARAFFPASRLYVWGLPLLIATFPQDVLYGINSDVLSPLLFGAAFIGALRCALFPSKSPLPHAATGFLAAAAVLVKWTNLAILPALCIAAWRSEGKKADRSRALAMTAAAAGPILVWCLWKYASAGDLTGDGEKARWLGWTVVPMSAWIRHPIFKPAGALFFIHSFFKTFWRGELIWHGRRLFKGPWDYFFTGSSCLFIAAAAATLRRERDAREKTAALAALACLAAFLAGLVWISLRFDFGSTVYPSRALPFFYSGRLALGMLVPFLFLYLRGLKALTKGWTDRARLGAAGALAAFLLALGVAPLLKVAPSRYNFFHLPR